MVYQPSFFGIYIFFLGKDIITSQTEPGHPWVFGGFFHPLLLKAELYLG
jgi:hypothetical protein